ncbi:aromatic ring-hydroxylating dioxygenase subunit alpha [Ferrovibrio sp.]|jgi:salicylate 5-hydroxylase large subunit|uniref:aromatic ring-hydroxylating dioxygenase subunit alpha n=1 Tax=Ferrovibrio sp. TaxID=1917215 RepID=UPI0035AEAB9C
MTIHAELPRAAAADALPRWEGEGASRVPYWAYTDPAVYRRELERFFHGGGHWCYVALEAELPKPGDYKLSYVGERQVIVVRDRDGKLNVVENRCAHRGVRFCQKQRGSARSFVCPYHQWTYKLNGDLAGLPFRHGVKKEDGSVQGGMPEDFDLKQHGLTKLKVATYNGLVFASFSPDAPALEHYFGPNVMPWLNRIFNGRKLTILGTNRQRIPGNWKLMMENIKDPYHPGLLHTWFVTFGLWRADQQSRMVMDKEGRHAVMISQRNAGGEVKAVTEGVTSFKKDMALNDPRLLDVVPENWWNGPTVTMITLFPSVIIQQQVNSLSTRHIVPAGPDAFDFVWTHFGFEEDDEAMTRRRLRQANLFGPAGFVSADDGEVIEFSQDGFRQNGGTASTICELDGREAAPTPHMVTETLIRGMYGYWRKVMEI